MFIAQSTRSGVIRIGSYLGGSGTDYGIGVAVYGGSNAYVSGQTNSTDFPTKNPLQSANGGSFDAFVAKLSSSGSALVYSTYLGGNGSDYANGGFALDASGNVYVTGQTSSTNFPTLGPIQPAYGGGNWDAFVVKIASLESVIPSSSGMVPWHPHYTVPLSQGLSASVDLADGHVDVTADDMTIPGVGIDLSLAHVWDSAIAQSTATSTVAGQGWNTDLTQGISTNGGLTDTVTWHTASGAAWNFSYLGSPGDPGPAYTNYASPPGIPWQLSTNSGSTTARYVLTNILTGDVLTFDNNGNLVSTADSYGNKNALTPGGTLPTSESNTTATGVTTRALSLNYNAGNLLSEVKSPLWVAMSGSQGQDVQYTYGPATGCTAAQLCAISRAGEPAPITLGYDSSNRLTSITTPGGHTWGLGWTGTQLTSITSPISGTVGQLGYTPAYTTQIQYNAGQTIVTEGYNSSTGGAIVTTYALDGQGQATVISDSYNDRDQYVYDNDHDVLLHQDPNNNQTTSAYQYVGPGGNVGLLTNETLPPISTFLGGADTPVVLSNAYDANNNLVDARNSATGSVRKYFYNTPNHDVTAAEELATVTTGGSYLWRGRVNTYNAMGELKTSVDGRGRADQQPLGDAHRHGDQSALYLDLDLSGPERRERRSGQRRLTAGHGGA